MDDARNVGSREQKAPNDFANLWRGSQLEILNLVLTPQYCVCYRRSVLGQDVESAPAEVTLCRTRYSNFQCDGRPGQHLYGARLAEFHLRSMCPCHSWEPAVFVPTAEGLAIPQQKEGKEGSLVLGGGYEDRI